MDSEPIEYEKIADVFDPDIAVLRDIYVTGTTVEDWQTLLDALNASSQWQSALFRGDSPMAEQVEAFEIFGQTSPDDDTYSVRVTVGGIWLWTHFFSSEEIEFSFQAAAIDSNSRFQELLAFMQFVANSVRKEAKLAIEAPSGEDVPPIILCRPEMPPEFMGM